VRHNVDAMPIRPSRIYHVNVNCSDLERSLAFYIELLGLRPLTRTTPEKPQPGGAFGLDEVQWDAWILQGDEGTDGIVLDLLEWQVPPPTGAPATQTTTTGYNRLCVSVPGLDDAYERLRGAGADCWSAPTALDLGNGRTVRAFVCSDPDGTQLELIQGERTRLSHVIVNCADLEASSRYYAEVIGLEPAGRMGPVRQDGAMFRLDGDVELTAALFRDPVTRFMVELVGWSRPEPATRPAPVANQLGIFRMAWVTDDIDRDHAELQAAGVSCFAPPAELEMGPGIPALRALFWRDPDGACLELIQPGTR
jgi:catechol 2,3-dioxygenase-like lactoylglutathione lyase family enzyme